MEMIERSVLSVTLNPICPLFTDEEEEDGVGDEECAAAVLVGEVGEAPDVADADGEADAREDELPLGAPVVPLRPVLQGVGVILVEGGALNVSRLPFNISLMLSIAASQ